MSKAIVDLYLEWDDKGIFSLALQIYFLKHKFSDGFGFNHILLNDGLFLGGQF